MVRAKPPSEAEALLVFERSMKAENLSFYLQPGNAKKTLRKRKNAKKLGGHKTRWGGAGAKLDGPVPSAGLGLKPPPIRKTLFITHYLLSSAFAVLCLAGLSRDGVRGKLPRAPRRLGARLAQK